MITGFLLVKIDNLKYPKYISLIFKCYNMTNMRIPTTLSLKQKRMLYRKIESWKCHVKKTF